MVARHRWSLWAVLIVPILVAAVVGGLALRSRDGDGGAPDGASGTVDLEATDAVAVGSVQDMAAAAECVLRGQVVHTERGRPIAAGLVSRLVQIRVDRALVGDCPTGTVVLEEEGWLDDGTEVTVDGWPGSEVGDVGIWFLVPGVSDELPYASTVAVAGAPRWRDGRSVAPTGAPPWVLDAVRDGPDALAESVASAG